MDQVWVESIQMGYVWFCWWKVQRCNNSVKKTGTIQIQGSALRSEWIAQSVQLIWNYYVVAHDEWIVFYFQACVNED